MSRKNTFLIALISLIAISAVNVVVLNINYPNVGHDYRYFIPRFLDSYVHYLKNGPCIQWWTPAFGGGLPSFPNPQQAQFSLPQALIFFMNPWYAINISVMVFGIVGFWGMYRLCRVILSMTRQESILGAVLFSVTGFFIQHQSVGHLNYMTFPLLPLLIRCCIDRNQPKALSAVIGGMILSISIHSAGFYLFVVYFFSIALVIVCILMINRHYPLYDLRLRSCMIRIGGIGIVFILISLSKILAVQSFMQQFPRLSNVSHRSNIFMAFFGVLGQLFYTPISFITRLNADHHLKFLVGVDHGLWELDIGLSPVVFGVVIFLGTYLFRTRLDRLKHLYISDLRHIDWKGRLLHNWRLRLSLIALLWLSFEFCTVKGIFYPLFFQKLPIIRSFSNNVRFPALYVIPLIMVVLVGLRRYPWKSGTPYRQIIGILIALAIVLYVPYIFIAKSPSASAGFAWLFKGISGFGSSGGTVAGSYFSLDITSSYKDWENLKNNYDDFRIKKIGYNGDFEVFSEASASGTNIYEPLFGTSTFNNRFTVYPVMRLSRGSHFNITNPASLIYPAENNCRPFDLIQTSDWRNFYDFIAYRPTTWKIPRWQRLADSISLFSLIAGVAVLLWQGIAFLRMRNRTRLSSIVAEHHDPPKNLGTP